MPKRALRQVRDGLISLAYPENCRLCGKTIDSWDDGVACDQCWNDPAITELFCDRPVCAKCGSPKAKKEDTSATALQKHPDHPGPIPSNSNQSVPGQLSETATFGEAQWECGRCTKLPFAAARACGEYSGALEVNLLFLKSHPHLCQRLRKIIAGTLSRHRRAISGDVIIPVPLHSSRQRERGFNQARIIARTVSRLGGVRLGDGLLVRVKQTERHRAGMDAIDRTRSVERAFEVVRPRAIEGASVLLVDDVYTTGSTICAAAQSLLESSALRVSVFTIGRVTRP